MSDGFPPCPDCGGTSGHALSCPGWPFRRVGTFVPEMSPELAAALEELRGLRLALAAETEARKELGRRLDAVTAERDRLAAAAAPACEWCGRSAASPLDFLYWPSTPERPMGDGVRHVVHVDCTEALAERLAAAVPPLR